MDNRDCTDRLRRPSDRPRHVSHPRKAHFREEIEVVFINGNDSWPMLLQYRLEFRGGFFKHGVEGGYGDAMLP
jgi:hypothetical protein